MTSGATARNLIAPVLRWGYRLNVHGGHRCPRRGPLLVIAPHLGFLDATVIATCLPRPVDVLVDQGGLHALGGRLPGRIVIEDDDPGAGLREAAERLRRGGAVGAWIGGGHEHAAGYLLAQTDAAVLPVLVAGGSARHAGDPPKWRARIDVVIGEPVRLDPPRDRLSRAEILRCAEALRQLGVDHAEYGARRMGYADGVGVEGRDRRTDNGVS